MKKFFSSLAGASIVLSFLSLFSKGIGFIREIIYADKFGLSTDFDLFLVSSAVPLTINIAVIFLCQHYFIPVFNKVKNNSSGDGNTFFNYTFWWFITGSLVVVLILFLSAPLFIDYYISVKELRDTGLQLYLLFLFTIPLNSGISVISAYLQANFKFIYPAVIQIVINVLIILLIIIFSDSFQVFVFPAGYIISYIAAFLLLFQPLSKHLRLRPQEIFKVHYKMPGLSILISLLFIEGLSLSYQIIDRYFWDQVPEGGIAALNYANVIFFLPVSVISISLITTFFSKFSKEYDNFKVLSGDFLKSVSVNFYIIIPVFFLLFIWGDLFIGSFYERGEFTSGDTLMTFNALKSYTIGLIFYSGYLIAVKLFYSINKYKFVLIISICAFILKIILNAYLVKLFAQDGLALSTSFIFIFLFLTGFLGVNKFCKIEKKNFHFNIIFYLLFNSFLSYLIVSLFSTIFFEGLLNEIFQILFFISIYVFNSYILDSDEYNLIKNVLTQMFNINKEIKI